MSQIELIKRIKAEVDAGHTVFGPSRVYRVIKDSVDQYLIHCTVNDNYIGLHDLAETKLNYNEFGVSWKQENGANCYETLAVERDISEYTNDELMKLINGSADVDEFITLPIWIAEQILDMDHVCSVTRSWAFQVLDSSVDGDP